MKVEYEGRTYETEPSPRVVYCRNCGKKMPENWIEEWLRVETPTPQWKIDSRRKWKMQNPTGFGINPYGDQDVEIHHNRGRKLYTRTYGYGGESLFCTLRCGYSWACKTYVKHPYNFNGAYK
jgi:hypothetical protein